MLDLTDGANVSTWREFEEPSDFLDGVDLLHARPLTFVEAIRADLNCLSFLLEPWPRVRILVACIFDNLDQDSSSRSGYHY